MRDALLALLLLSLGLAGLWSVLRQGGQQVVSAAALELQVQGNGQLIMAGSYDPSPLNGTELAPAVVDAEMVDQSLTFSNPMPWAVELAPAPGWLTEGGDADDFFLVSPLPRHLHPGEVLTTDLRFAPSGQGLRTTMLRIPYRPVQGNAPWTSVDFRVQGRGVGPGSLLVYGPHPQQRINHGSLEVSEGLGTDLGIITGPDERAMTTLHLSNRQVDSRLQISEVRLLGPHAADFTLLTHPAPMHLGHGQTLDLTIQLRPRHATPGPRQALLGIRSNDPQNPWFFCLIAGTVLPASEG